MCCVQISFRLRSPFLRQARPGAEPWAPMRTRETRSGRMTAPASSLRWNRPERSCVGFYALMSMYCPALPLASPTGGPTLSSMMPPPGGRLLRIITLIHMVAAFKDCPSSVVQNLTCSMLFYAAEAAASPGTQDRLRRALPGGRCSGVWGCSLAWTHRGRGS